MRAALQETQLYSALRPYMLGDPLAGSSAAAVTQVQTCMYPGPENKGKLFLVKGSNAEVSRAQVTCCIGLAVELQACRAHM